jgi:hypothetical protein
MAQQPATAVGSRRITAWAIARPCSCLIQIYYYIEKLKYVFFFNFQTLNERKLDEEQFVGATFSFPTQGKKKAKEKQKGIRWKDTEDISGVVQHLSCSY